MYSYINNNIKTESISDQSSYISDNILSLIDFSFKKFSTKHAVSDEQNSLTYEDLRCRVNDIAAHLARSGCRARDIVALFVSNNTDLIAAILATLKLGATYIPIDVRSPEARRSYILKDSAASFIIYSADNETAAAGASALSICLDTISECADAIPWHVPNKTDIAYILYTSGSTGYPKGVQVTLDNLLHYSVWASGRYFKSARDKIALYTTPAFDFTVTCIFPPLIKGASIAIYDGVRDPMVLQQVLTDPTVNVIKITPSYLSVLSELLDDTASFERIIVGGENLPADLTLTVHNRLAGRAEIINEYGPTEATVGCIVHRYDPVKDTASSVPIGRPIDGMRAHIVDNNGKILEDGQEGELYLSGSGLATGYLNMPEQTQKAFTRLPALGNVRVYKTGDIAVRRPGGVLTFLGRRDDQVKIRGNRVELAEVEAAIRSIPGVETAYATAVPEAGTHALVAVATGDPALVKDDLLAALRDLVPAYMLPTTFDLVAEIPMTANQKIDKTKVLKLLGR